MRSFWNKTVQFKLLTGYTLILLALVLTTILVLHTQLRSQLEEQTLQQVDSYGEVIVAELVRQTSIVNTLTQSLVHFTQSAGQNGESIHRTLPRLISLANSEAVIAGGGYWPEPFQFDSQRERASFFWGRNGKSQLEYYDDYNHPDGPGYHHEEWYAPARHLEPGKCYWSRSYTDPYSGQPMVTCTVPSFVDQAFIGAATIDLKLAGLTQLIAQYTRNTGGYAFVVDQHNRFISFPEHVSVFSEETRDHITAKQLFEREPDFKSIYQCLSDLNETLITSVLNDKNFDPKLAKKIAADSYQISMEEAEVIAAALHNPRHSIHQQNLLLKRLEIEKDFITGDASTVSIFHVPDAYWKVVMVTPKHIVLSNVQQLIQSSLNYLLLPLLVIMLLAFLGIRSTVLKPIASITNALKQSVKQGGFSLNPLDESREDEFGQLAHWYNQKNQELQEAIHKLSQVNQELSYHADYDALTDLSNRRHFEKRMQALIDDDEWANYSLIYLDMDQFKVINDTCGHVAGDQLLIQIGYHLKQIVRSGDSVARIGGDEFAIISRTPNRKTVEQLAERIIKNISAVTFSWEGSSFSISCSIGVLYLADIAPNATLAMRHVDTACYAAKEAGRNRYHLYQQNDLASVRAGEMNWIAKINDAFSQDLFVSEFQLIAPTALDENSLPCIESLVRIKKEDGSLIPPGAFLPAAERYNAIAKIDRWVICNTIRTLANNPDTLKKIRFCSVNLSGDSICADDLVDFIREKLQEYELPASKLCFEITETQAVFNIQKAKTCLQKLKELGSLIALDDFGSGMSSYGYLTQLPVNFLKIDGSFVKNIRTDHVHLTFVKSMGDIANAMGLETIAEFVEDLETYHLLQSIGIGYAQGFGIAKPLSIERLARLLDEDITLKSSEA